MGKVKGRPPGSQGPKKVSAGKSRLNTKCAVCSLTQRADKIKEHQVKSVLWSEDGSSAADESHPGYASLSDHDRSHTDFFRKNGFTRFKLPKLFTTSTLGTSLHSLDVNRMLPIII